MSIFVLAVTSSLVFLTPPALPDDTVSDFREEQQKRADLYSPQAKKLVEQFFEKIGEGEAFDLTTLFTADAQYVEDGNYRQISANLYDDGTPDIGQWSLVAMGVLEYNGSLAAVAEMRLERVGSVEAVLKFYFVRNGSGALRIGRIEEVRI